MKLTKILFSLLFIGISIDVSCQNLVPNPQFEELEFCPNQTGQLEALNAWFNVNPDGSPDYFHTCFEDNGFDPDPDVPQNSFGFQESRSGDGYAGIFTYGLNVREYIQVQLLTPLEKDQIYSLQMYVSSTNEAAWAISSLGMYLSEEPTTGSGTYFVLDHTPQVTSPYDLVLSDTVNWTLISGQYTAEGNERFLTIGNFLPDSLTNANVLNSSGIYQNQSYYYIEDVSVRVADPVNTQDLQKSEIKIYPNPADDFLNLQINDSDIRISHLTIYDINGKKIIFKDKLPFSNGHKIDISNLIKGIYFYHITSTDGRLIDGKFLKR